MANLGDLELLKEKVLQEFTSQKAQKLAELNQFEQIFMQKLNELDSAITEIKTVEKFKAEIKNKLENGTLTKADFDSLTEDQKQLFKDVLFDYFASKVNVYHALSAAEFILIPIAKLLFKVIDGEQFTNSELDFITMFKTIINQHPMAIDNPDTWELVYADTELKETIERRNTYLQTKLELTGEL